LFPKAKAEKAHFTLGIEKLLWASFPSFYGRTVIFFFPRLFSSICLRRRLPPSLRLGCRRRRARRVLLRLPPSPRPLSPATIAPGGAVGARSRRGRAPLGGAAGARVRRGRAPLGARPGLGSGGGELPWGRGRGSGPAGVSSPGAASSLTCAASFSPRAAATASSLPWGRVLPPLGGDDRCLRPVGARSPGQRGRGSWSAGASSPRRRGRSSWPAGAPSPYGHGARTPSRANKLILISSPKQTWSAFLKNSFLEKQAELFGVELLEKLQLPQTGVFLVCFLLPSWPRWGELKSVNMLKKEP